MLLFFATQARLAETNESDEGLAKKIEDLDEDELLTRLMGAALIVKMRF